MFDYIAEVRCLSEDIMRYKLNFLIWILFYASQMIHGHIPFIILHGASLFFTYVLLY